MDKITIGELLALYYAVGMTAEINDGKVVRIDYES
jgi:hypothetical protein